MAVYDRRYYRSRGTSVLECISRNSKFGQKKVGSLACLKGEMSTFLFHSDPPVNVCAPQLAALLGCWAATNDLASKSQQCSDAAMTLFQCMRTTVGLDFL
jgi:hypothetical protein